MSNGTDEPKIEILQEVVIAVDSKNMADAVALYEDAFGVNFDLEWEIPREHIHVKAAYVGDTQLQIVEATSPEGVIAKFVKERGEGLNHIAFQVKNLPEMVANLKKKGLKVIPDEPIIGPTPESIAKKMGLSPGESQISYAFVHPASTHGVLIELVEIKT